MGGRYGVTGSPDASSPRSLTRRLSSCATRVIPSSRTKGTVTMPLPPRLALSEAKAKRIKMAGGCSCELCGESRALPELEIHLVPMPGRPPSRRKLDLQSLILVVCPRCHHDLHAFSVPLADQRELIAYRPYRMKQAIRAVLGYRPKPYIPPDDFDPATVFETLDRSAWGFGV